ncbi:PPE domain-containing protein [Nocardia sp. XZ_19_385]|uniref:PPE domain-containing protein n=1 Tax=Nocardia sp. XZ_19_385 TaxID=2769488 RepID=UPI00188E07F0|nr:PPE domain-containing protein [Nocardia sp. XZ_19_385]
MTAGITGVFWLPRMAEANSIALNAGAHAVPISAASSAWGALTGVWVEATATVARVVAELGVGLQGVNGMNAIGKLAGFTGWAEQQGVLAAAMSAKAAANATAYTVASIAMPSLPEIVALNTARAASHTTGGALRGDAEVLEAAKAAMDLRAALTMETYEAATTAQVSTPGEFSDPPHIAEGAGAADPISMALSAVSSAVQHAGGAATQVANVAGSVASSAVGTGANLAGAAVSAVTAPAGAGAAMVAPAAAAVTAPAAAITVASTVGASTVQLPAGWGTPATVGGSGLGSMPASSSGMRMESTATRPASNLNSPLTPTRAANDEDEEHERKSAVDLQDDQFTDGRFIADGVIGANTGQNK